MSDRLTQADILAADLADWRMIGSRLHATYATGSFAAGLALVNRIGEAAEAADHHPDVTLTYPRVEVRLSSHDVGAVTRRDLALARTISDLARQAGVTSDTRDTVVE